MGKIQSITIYENFTKRSGYFPVVSTFPLPGTDRKENGVDSLKDDDDLTPFRNIRNGFYARSIRRKTRSAFKSNGMSGKYLTCTVIYGCPWDEKREYWLVDEEAAEVVLRISSLTIEGYVPHQISTLLSEKAKALAQGEFTSPEQLKETGGAALWAAEPKQKDTLFSVSFCLKCQINLDIYSPKDPDFCPAALLRRTSVFAAGGNLGAGRIHSARACKIKEWRPPPAARTQKERHDVSRVFLFGAGKGNRTLIFSLGS